MLKIATVFGTRPEAVKMAPVVRALEADPDLEQRVIVTAQHRQMLDQVLTLFEIEPDVDLDVMTPGQTLAGLTSRLIVALTDLLAAEKPDVILVQGDTTSSFVAALAAYYNHIAVGHVEAGLRTWDKYAPWPEEINRQLTGRIADVHFAPTEQARANLLAEGVADERIVVTGNTVIDALLWVRDRLDREAAAGRLDVDTLFGANALGVPITDVARAAIASIERGESRLVLITGHRRESFGGGFERICRAIAVLAARYPDCQFIYPVHLNPQVQAPVLATLGPVANVHLLPPLDYLPFVRLLSLCTLVLTDSGGLQEEAPSLAKPVLVMRDTTERPEGIEVGTAALVGTEEQTIVAGVARLLDDPAHYERMSRAVNPYGDGRASERIVARLKQMGRRDGSDG